MVLVLQNDMVQATVDAYHLNPDQATALQLVAGMLATDTEDNAPHSSITLIHGKMGMSIFLNLNSFILHFPEFYMN